MKLKIFILILGILSTSWCSFINQDNIEESENIIIDDFIKTQINAWNIELEKTDIEAQKIEEEFENLINILFEVSN